MKMLRRNLDIKLKTSDEIEIMREAGKISSLALWEAGRAVRPGISTKELDEIALNCIKSHGAIPSFLGVDGFPACACISVNEELVHFIPSKDKILKEGDIVTIDVGAGVRGFHGDNAYTFPCGKVSDEASKLLEITKNSLQKGIDAAKIGNRIGDIGNAVQSFVEAAGFSIIRRFVGHGIGQSVHEAPSVPNFGKKNTGELIQEGLVIAIEPMVAVGNPEVEALRDDGWNVVMKDRSLSAHFEHTVAITEDGVIVLTSPNF